MDGYAVSIRMLAALLLTLFIVGSAQAQQRPPCCDMWDPGWMHRDMWGPQHMGPGQRQRMTRHWTFMHQGVPDEYGGTRNPHPRTAEVIDEGHRLYAENCASCHGTTGMGDGDAGKALNPSPALLAYMIQMPMSVDAYMLWTISEGGAPFGTDMPAFKDSLSRDDIWKIVTYMRAGFPKVADRQ